MSARQAIRSSRWRSTIGMLMLGLATAAQAGAQVCGDSDGSQTVTVTDGVQVLRSAAGLGSPCTLAICDMDLSHSVTVTDGITVLRIAAGFTDGISCLGAEEDRLRNRVLDTFGVLTKLPALPGAAGAEAAGAGPCPDGGSSVATDEGFEDRECVIGDVVTNGVVTFADDGQERLVSFEGYTTRRLSTNESVVSSGGVIFKPKGGGVQVDGEVDRTSTIVGDFRDRLVGVVADGGLASGSVVTTIVDGAGPYRPLETIGGTVGDDDLGIDRVDRKPCGGTNACGGDPTFIQMPEHADATEHGTHGDARLEARITVPVSGALIRGEVPVFGIAAGTDFAGYRVEYGKGAAPTEWTRLSEGATTVRDAVETQMVAVATGDQSVPGSLATWDTGLATYVYLPMYPPDHPVDLKGTYTLRLVVAARDGRTVEDRVTVAVGDVIPNAWGGTVTSDDRRVRLEVPEQALFDSFRVILLEASGEAPPSTDGTRTPVGPVYRVRDADERFAKDATLTFRMPPALATADLPRLGVYGYTAASGWRHLPSVRTADGDVATKVGRLHAQYALMLGDAASEGSQTAAATAPPAVVPIAASANTRVLVRDDFENGLGGWAARDGELGARIAVEPGAGPDGTAALRVAGGPARTNLAVTMRAAPFDAYEYPIVELAYRVPQGVRTNVLAKVAGRWYEVGFTDDPKPLDGARVNIAHVGDVDGVVADGRWHTVRFDLYAMLRTRTAHAVVDELIMADWDLGGYMKLEPGRSAAATKYWIDAFSISRASDAPPREGRAATLPVHFRTVTADGSAATGGTVLLDPAALGSLTARGKAGPSRTAGDELTLVYDVTRSGSFAVYRAALPSMDLRRHARLSFRVARDEGERPPTIGLVDARGRERQLRVPPAWLASDGAGVAAVSLPLQAFGPDVDLASVVAMTIGFGSGVHTRGRAVLSEVRFEPDQETVLVESFEEPGERNLLDLAHAVFARGDAAVTGAMVKNSPNGVLRLSYGGNIATPSDHEPGLSFAAWKTDLGGLDCSTCAVLRLRARGSRGGERPNVYLHDGNQRWGVDLEAYAPITTSWGTYEIPLDDFAKRGVDVSHLERLEIVFEWEPMNGSVYFDDLAFGRRQAAVSGQGR